MCGGDEVRVVGKVSQLGGVRWSGYDQAKEGGCARDPTVLFGQSRDYELYSKGPNATVQNTVQNTVFSTLQIRPIFVTTFNDGVLKSQIKVKVRGGRVSS